MGMEGGVKYVYTIWDGARFALIPPTSWNLLNYYITLAFWVLAGLAHYVIHINDHQQRLYFNTAGWSAEGILPVLQMGLQSLVLRAD